MQEEETLPEGDPSGGTGGGGGEEGDPSGGTGGGGGRPAPQPASVPGKEGEPSGDTGGSGGEAKT